MKFKKKSVVIILLMLLIIIVVSFLYSRSESKIEKEPNGKQITELLKVYGNFSAPEGEKYFLNIYYFYSGKDDLQSGIERVEFVDAKDIEVTSFKIIDSVNIQEYTLKSVPLEVVFHKKGNYKIEKVKIIDKNGGNHVLNVGQLNVKVGEKNSDQDIRVADKFPVMRTDFSSYIFTLDNLTKNDITVSDIDFRSDDLKYNFDKTIIKANSNIKDEIKFNFNNDKYTYYIIRPKIGYQVNGETKYFYPTLTYYDINAITKESLEKSLKSK